MIILGQMDLEEQELLFTIMISICNPMLGNLSQVSTKSKIAKGRY